MQVANRGDSSTVGLLCSSTPEFILTWLGLMRLGKSVMLLAWVMPLRQKRDRSQFLTSVARNWEESP